MRLERLRDSPAGQLVPITGHDPRYLEDYEHWAFVPAPLPETVTLSPDTWAVIAEAMHALGRLDQAGRQLPNPAVVLRPTLRREAQSTSALEGTFAPLTEILEADLDDEVSRTPELIEILNYVRAAEYGYQWAADRPISMSTLFDLHSILMSGTKGDNAEKGRIRSHQVVIGAPADRVADARFVPPPAGADLEAAVRGWVDWVNRDHPQLPAVVQAALAHYQFETLHPLNDGNGRIGRLLIVLQLIRSGVFRDPLLTVSPWFEARRLEYQDQLQAVSETGSFDPWVAFFVQGIRAQAQATAAKIGDLSAWQENVRRLIRQNDVRGVGRDIAENLTQRPVISPSWASRNYQVSYVSANNGISRLERIGLIREATGRTYRRMFVAEEVLRILER